MESKSEEKKFGPPGVHPAPLGGQYGLFFVPRLVSGVTHLKSAKKKIWAPPGVNPTPQGHPGPCRVPAVHTRAIWQVLKFSKKFSIT
jgi:hypothetical protein